MNTALCYREQGPIALEMLDKLILLSAVCEEIETAADSVLNQAHDCLVYDELLEVIDKACSPFALCCIYMLFQCYVMYCLL